MAACAFLWRTIFLVIRRRQSFSKLSAQWCHSDLLRRPPTRPSAAVAASASASTSATAAAAAALLACRNTATGGESFTADAMTNSIVPLVCPVLSSHATARSFHQSCVRVSGGPRRTRWRCTNRQNPGMTFSVMFRIVQFPSTPNAHCVAQEHAATRLVFQAQVQVKHYAIGLVGTATPTWCTESMTVQQLHILVLVHHVS